MNQDLREAKLKQFVNDQNMSTAVFDTLLSSFLKKRPNQDVYLLAASRLAVDYLNEAMETLSRFGEEKIVDGVQKNIGL